MKVQLVESRIPSAAKDSFCLKRYQEILPKLVLSRRRNVSVVCARCMEILGQLVCWYMFHAAMCGIAEVGFSELCLRTRSSL